MLYQLSYTRVWRDAAGDYGSFHEGVKPVGLRAPANRLSPTGKWRR
ncbi:MAG: hypothetical protein SFV23_12600 [Planctomycetaceae bacterium]|nr:hypothetical protein [Planctomycetaceae bacterium]